MAVQSAFSVAAENITYDEKIRINGRVTELRKAFLATTPYVCEVRSHLKDRAPLVNHHKKKRFP